MSLRHGLSDRRRYRGQIDRLQERYLFTRQLYDLVQDDVPLARLVQRGRTLARILGRTVDRGEYRLEPGTIREIKVDGKIREVYWFRLTDLIVHGVVAELVEEAMAPALSPRLYSYRKGVSWWSAVSDFASYARRHRRSRPDPLTRGLYVLRRDINSYTDTIPVGGGSPVWDILRRTFADAGTPATRPQDWALVEEIVRPQVKLEKDALVCHLKGVPTGQPISVALFNLYLTPFDREFDSIPGAFYARYSDDILFAHPSPDVVTATAARMDEHLFGLGLEVNPEKDHRLYLTGPGRRPQAWPEGRGARWIPFLGANVDAAGTVSLNRRKARALLREIDDRAFRTARALRGDLDRRGRAICSVVNQVLDPRASPFQQRSATLLRRAVTDRAQLRNLDYLIARVVLRAATGDRSIRAFRTVPYRKIRAEWGLVSLLHARNTWGRRRSA